MIEFHLNAARASRPTSNLSSRCAEPCGSGSSRSGDQLPTVKDVVARLAINPNTVLKAYRELEHSGLVAARPGVGTFVTSTLSDASLAAHGPLRASSNAGLRKAEGPVSTTTASRPSSRIPFEASREASRDRRP